MKTEYDKINEGPRRKEHLQKEHTKLMLQEADIANKMLTIAEKALRHIDNHVAREAIKRMEKLGNLPSVFEGMGRK